MYIPVQLGSRAELRIYPRDEEARDSGGEVAVGAVVEGERCNDLVEVQR